MIYSTLCHQGMPADYNKANIILELYKIFDSHRDSRLWILDELDVVSYEDFQQKYKGQLPSGHILLLFVVSLSYLVSL